MLNFCLRPPHNFPTVTVHAQRLNLQNQCLHLQQDSGLSWQNQKDWREYLGVCVCAHQWMSACENIGAFVVFVHLWMPVCTCILFIFSPGPGVSSVWRHGEPEEPSAHLLFVGRLRHGPQQHSWATILCLFWPMGEIRLTVGLRLTNKRWSAPQRVPSLHQIADGQRELIRSHSVKNRHFIGNTSMDAALSFIMANHAKVKENDVVFDPFVGTGEIISHRHGYSFFGMKPVSINGISFLFWCVSGSLLVACSQFKAYVCGTDIDYNIIHGKGKSGLNCTSHVSVIF